MTAGRVALQQVSSVMVLVGLTLEARIVHGPDVLVVCRTQEYELSRSLQAAVRRGCRSLISFGVAGGLAPDLRPGDCIVASAIVDSHQLRPTDPAWSRKLSEMVPGARYAPIAGVNAILSSPSAKRNLFLQTGAAAVDMESHLVGRLAAVQGLTFATLRVIIDPADRVVPAAAQVAMSRSGGTNLMLMLCELIRRPSQLVALLRIVRDAYVAHCALLRLRRLLGPGFGIPRAVRPEQLRRSGSAIGEAYPQSELQQPVSFRRLVDQSGY